MKAVVFDLDDTLYNERDFVLGGFRAVASYLSGLKSLDSDIMLSRMVEILEDTGRGKIFDTIIDEYNIDVPVKKLVEIYRTASMKLQLYPDAKTCLERLRNKGYNIGLITDGLRTVQWHKIHLLNIKDYFDEILVTNDLGDEFYKPKEEVYIEMAKRLDILLEEMAYVGDNPNKDFIGAKALGITTFRIIREYGCHRDVRLNDSYEAHYIINTLDELDKYF